jgi:hypothetical protein
MIADHGRVLAARLRVGAGTGQSQPMHSLRRTAAMSVIKTVDGQDIDVNENAIVLIAGPYPHDVGPHTYVYGATHGALVTGESADGLVARLGINPLLAKLTRPDSSPVWVKGSTVTSVRVPIPTEQQGPGQVNAVLQVGSLHQTVHEDVPTARSIINAHGGNI